MFFANLPVKFCTLFTNSPRFGRHRQTQICHSRFIRESASQVSRSIRKFTQSPLLLNPPFDHLARPRNLYDSAEAAALVREYYGSRRQKYCTPELVKTKFHWKMPRGKKKYRAGQVVPPKVCNLMSLGSPNAELDGFAATAPVDAYGPRKGTNGVSTDGVAAFCMFLTEEPFGYSR